MTEPNRIGRVKRFYQDNDHDSDVWIDVEIVDELILERGRGPAYQKTRYKFLTRDSDKNTVRETKTLTVKNPDDENTSVDIKITEALDIAGGVGPAYQRRHVIFDNGAKNDDRAVHIKRVIHNNIADEFLDENRNPPENAQDYLNAIIATDEQDFSQFLNVEVIDEFIIETGRGPAYQKTRYRLDHSGDILMADPLIAAPE